MDGLRVHLLCAFEIEGVDHQGLGSRKARTLLKVLALARGHPVSADRLADCLWGDDPPARPGDQLAVLVSRLRRVLGADRLRRVPAGYELAVDWLDVAELEERVEEAAAHLAATRLAAARSVARAAVSLARGELVADEPDPWWADADRAATARATARARHVAAEASLRAGDAAAVLDHDPYDEVALRLLMRSHGASGRPASALAAYATARARLADELGVSPTSETEALHMAILRDERVEGAASRSTAPSTLGPTSLPGREREIATLDDALDRAATGDLTFVVVEGEAGIGKTALVELWADVARAHGAVVLHGRCDPMGRELPFQPIADALDHRLRTLEPDRAEAVLADIGAVLEPILGRRSTAEPVRASPPEVSHALVVVFEALLDAIVRTGAGDPTALVLDDVHLAGTSTIEWLHFAARRREGRPLLVVVTRRPDEGLPLDLAATHLPLGPLDHDAVAAIVGPERADELGARSGGHPLFLVELARAPSGQLPASIRDAVARRADAAGPDVGVALRTAALLGASVDVDLLAAVLSLPASRLVDHLEDGVRRRLLEERAEGFAFHHELLREAMAAGLSSGRRALIHRDAAAVLARRPDADPLTIAYHAHLGGDAEREAAALVRAAAIAGDRFDYDTADALAGRAIAARDSPDARLQRGRIRLMQRRLDEAQADAGAALAAGAGAEAMEVAAWIAYYGRHQRTAIRLATDGARLAEDSHVRARCLTVLGRARHSLGEVGRAEADLRSAVELTEGPETTIPAVWLGSLLVHTGHPDEALDLIRPATRPGLRFGLSPAPLYAYMHGAYAAGCLGRPMEAMAFVEPLGEEVRRRGVTRFLGVADNLRAWILRNLGARAEADAANEATLAEVPFPGIEPNVHAELDLVLGQILAGDAAGASRRLAGIDRSLPQLQTFRWRADLRRLYLGGRLALLEEDWDGSRHKAAELHDLADAQRAPRYRILAGLVDAEAAFRSGEGADRERVDALLRELPRQAGLESWWLVAGLAAAASEPRWWGLAHERVAALAAAAGPHADAFTRAAGQRLPAP